ncbi:unnamed protein product [Trifolium pratense]|uniref:Uncharacterized protein n=1 Tax=Trifolium pratense TaxID=57577 RepID=A0ACB0LK36_TRIPR|nr:unnamed protein product [Trifolium pratense]
MRPYDNALKHKMDNEKFKLPVGFRFHPTDEELINQYLVNKVNDDSFSAIAIAEIDMNKCEPWDLAESAKIGETEWYFFCVRDRKYPTGQRTNRATNAGYWKATGKDKEIIKGNRLIGMKKTLVFYKGRAPRGEKTNWVMHEYRLEGSNTVPTQNLSKQGTGEWVISRVYVKGNCGKKMHGNSKKLGRFNSSSEGPSNANESLLPQLMDSSFNNETKTTFGDFSHVLNSFSVQNETMNIPSSGKQFGAVPAQNCFLSQQESMLRMQMENENIGTSSKQNVKQDFSLVRDYFDGDISSVVYGNNMFQRLYGNQEFASTSTEPVVTDCLWNY